MQESKPCSRCKQIKPFTEFGIHRKTKDGYASECLICKRARDKERYYANYEQELQRKLINGEKWAKANPEKIRQKQRNAALKYPEKARNKQGRRRAKVRQNGVFLISPKDLKNLLSKPCLYCGKHMPNMEVEHLIPIDRGGSHGIGNLTMLCQSCNRSKGFKLWMEWRLWKAKREGI